MFHLSETFNICVLPVLNIYLGRVCSNVTRQEKQESPFTAMTAVLFEGQLSFKLAENLYHVIFQKYGFGDGKQQAMT